MSFVEKNKAWLLPILGVGVASVIFMNYRNFKPSTPNPGVQGEPAAPAEAPDSSVQAAKPVTASTDLWADLDALAEPPRECLAAPELRTRCQRNLDELLDPHFPAELPRPGLVREATPISAAGSAASHPAAVRLKMIPRISPVITVPIARPLCSGGTSSGAIGTITCVTAEVVPITTEATASINNDGAAAATSMATPTAANSQVINPRRSATSPNGTNSRMPTA